MNLIKSCYPLSTQTGFVLIGKRLYLGGSDDHVMS